MNALTVLRTLLMVAAVACAVVVVVTGVANGVALLGLLCLAGAAFTFAETRRTFDPSAWVADDPDPHLSRLDQLDRGCCFVDHAESEPRDVDDLTPHPGAR